jgi:hypothetical protein
MGNTTATTTTIMNNYIIYLIGIVVNKVPPRKHMVKLKINDNMNDNASFGGCHIYNNIIKYLKIRKVYYIHINIVKYYYGGNGHYWEDIIGKLHITDKESYYTEAENITKYDDLSTIVSKLVVINELDLLPEIRDIIFHQVALLYLSL